MSIRKNTCILLSLERWRIFSYVIFIMNTQHTDEILFEKCRRNLAIIWFFGGGALYLLLILQSAAGYYGENIREVWSWFLPNILPTLSLIIGSTFTFGNTRTTAKISRFAARFSCCLSVGYLLTLGFTILLPPVIQLLDIFIFSNRLELLKSSNLWLAPFQGLVTAILGSLLVFNRSSDGN